MVDLCKRAVDLQILLLRRVNIGISGLITGSGILPENEPGSITFSSTPCIIGGDAKVLPCRHLTSVRRLENADL